MIVKVKDVIKLQTLTGAGRYDCKKALAKCNNDINVAYYYLRIISDCVCRHKIVNGKKVLWTDEDYINCAKEEGKK